MTNEPEASCEHLLASKWGSCPDKWRARVDRLVQTQLLRIFCLEFGTSAAPFQACLCSLWSGLMLLSSHVVFPTYSIFRRRYSTVATPTFKLSPFLSRTRIKNVCSLGVLLRLNLLVMASENWELKKLEMLDYSIGISGGEQVPYCLHFKHNDIIARSRALIFCRSRSQVTLPAC
jgi:hypothetical protein